MTSSRLPVNVIPTREVDEFYARSLEKNELGVSDRSKGNDGDHFSSFKVPQNRVNGRLQDPPELRGPTIEILGIGEEEAASDVVFSSAGESFFLGRRIRAGILLDSGWASVQCTRNEYVVLDVKTPDGLGIHLRQPSLLKYLFRLRGVPIEGTPFFEKPSSVTQEADSNDHSNEMQMIINEKLWKGEENKRQRRARRT